jgi:hypothetical protein
MSSSLLIENADLWWSRILLSRHSVRAFVWAASNHYTSVSNSLYRGCKVVLKHCLPENHCENPLAHSNHHLTAMAFGSLISDRVTIFNDLFFHGNNRIGKRISYVSLAWFMLWKNQEKKEWRGCERKRGRAESKTKRWKKETKRQSDRERKRKGTRSPGSLVVRIFAWEPFW